MKRSSKDFNQIYKLRLAVRKIESSPHQKLYVEYGFSLPENPEDSVPIELADMAGDNVDAARESGLTENMSISALGPTWNLGWNSSLKFLCYLSTYNFPYQIFLCFLFTYYNGTTIPTQARLRLHPLTEAGAALDECV